MKIRNIIYAGAAMIFAACSNSDSIDQAAKQVPLTINATIDGEATRSNSFGDGAQIGVYAGGKENVLFTADKDVNFTSETPIYFSSEKMTVKAYFPYSSSENTSKVINTADQTFLTDHLYAEATASAATGTANIVFRHLLSKVTLNVTWGAGYDNNNGVSTYSVTVSGLKTKATYTLPGTIEIADDSDDIHLTSRQSKTELLLIPQEAESFTLNIIIDRNEYAATVPVKGGKLEANTNYIYSVKIDKEKLTVSSSSSVAAWDVEKPEGYVDVIYSGE